MGQGVSRRQSYTPSERKDANLPHGGTENGDVKTSVNGKGEVELLSNAGHQNVTPTSSNQPSAPSSEKKKGRKLPRLTWSLKRTGSGKRSRKHKKDVNGVRPTSCPVGNVSDDHNSTTSSRPQSLFLEDIVAEEDGNIETVSLSSNDEKQEKKKKEKPSSPTASSPKGKKDRKKDDTQKKGKSPKKKKEKDTNSRSVTPKKEKAKKETEHTPGRTKVIPAVQTAEVTQTELQGSSQTAEKSKSDSIDSEAVSKEFNTADAKLEESWAAKIIAEEESVVEHTAATAVNTTEVSIESFSKDEAESEREPSEKAWTTEPKAETLETEVALQPANKLGDRDSGRQHIPEVLEETLETVGEIKASTAKNQTTDTSKQTEDRASKNSSETETRATVETVRDTADLIKTTLEEPSVLANEARASGRKVEVTAGLTKHTAEETKDITKKMKETDEMTKKISDWVEQKENAEEAKADLSEIPSENIQDSSLSQTVIPIVDPIFLSEALSQATRPTEREADKRFDDHAADIALDTTREASETSREAVVEEAKELPGVPEDSTVVKVEALVEAGKPEPADQQDKTTGPDDFGIRLGNEPEDRPESSHQDVWEKKTEATKEVQGVAETVSADSRSAKQGGNKTSAISVPSQLLPEIAPSQLSPESAPSQLSPESAPSQLSPENVHSQLSPENVHSQLSPESAPSQLLPENVHSQLSPENVHSQLSPENVHSQLSPESAPSQLLPENVHSQLSPENVPSQLSPMQLKALEKERKSLKKKEEKERAKKEKEEKKKLKEQKRREAKEKKQQEKAKERTRRRSQEKDHAMDQPVKEPQHMIVDEKMEEMEETVVSVSPEAAVEPAPKTPTNEMSQAEPEAKDAIVASKNAATESAGETHTDSGAKPSGVESLAESSNNQENLVMLGTSVKEVISSIENSFSGESTNSKSPAAVPESAYPIKDTAHAIPKSIYHVEGSIAVSSQRFPANACPISSPTVPENACLIEHSVSASSPTVPENACLIEHSSLPVDDAYTDEDATIASQPAIPENAYPVEDTTIVSPPTVMESTCLNKNAVIANLPAESAHPVEGTAIFSLPAIPQSAYPAENTINPSSPFTRTFNPCSVKSSPVCPNSPLSEEGQSSETSEAVKSEPCSPTSPETGESARSSVLRKIELGPRLRTAILRKSSSGTESSEKRVNLTQPRHLQVSDLTPPPRKHRPRKPLEHIASSSQVRSDSIPSFTPLTEKETSSVVEESITTAAKAFTDPSPVDSSLQNSAESANQLTVESELFKHSEQGSFASVSSNEQALAGESEMLDKLPVAKQPHHDSPVDNNSREISNEREEAQEETYLQPVEDIRSSWEPSDETEEIQEKANVQPEDAEEAVLHKVAIEMVLQAQKCAQEKIAALASAKTPQETSGGKIKEANEPVTDVQDSVNCDMASDFTVLKTDCGVAEKVELDSTKLISFEDSTNVSNHSDIRDASTSHFGDTAVSDSDHNLSEREHYERPLTLDKADFQAFAHSCFPQDLATQDDSKIKVITRDTLEEYRFGDRRVEWRAGDDGKTESELTLSTAQEKKQEEDIFQQKQFGQICVDGDDRPTCTKKEKEKHHTDSVECQNKSDDSFFRSNSECQNKPSSNLVGNIWKCENQSDKNLVEDNSEGQNKSDDNLVGDNSECQDKSGENLFQMLVSGVSESDRVGDKVIGSEEAGQNRDLEALEQCGGKASIHSISTVTEDIATWEEKLSNDQSTCEPALSGDASGQARPLEQQQKAVASCKGSHQTSEHKGDVNDIIDASLKVQDRTTVVDKLETNNNISAQNDNPEESVEVTTTATATTGRASLD